MKQYNKENIPLAKELRKNMTPWERKLWYDFLRQYPVQFQRQKALGNYIADFYCAKAKLVIELDGGGHYEPAQRYEDEIRTQNLEQMDLKVLRVCNLDVDQNFAGVCEHIDNIVRLSFPQSAALTAPSSEEALVRCKEECTSQKRRVTMESKKIIALGFFDGVHMGHGALLRACREMAKEMGCKAAALTFAQHPDAFVSGKAPRLINTIADRKRLLQDCYGMDEVILLNFDAEMMAMPHTTFFKLLVKKHGAAGMVCGHDFRFGKGGQGNARVLQQLCAEEGIACAVIPEQKIDGITVSSTYIRSLLEAGDIEKANRFLGHPHSVTAPVVPGRHLGQTLGTPTANQVLPDYLVQPRMGVYACKAYIDGEAHLAVTNLGNRPTVQGSYVTLESWILGFDGDLYGKELTVEFYAYLRPEEKFPTLEALREEILKDAAKTQEIFQKS